MVSGLNASTFSAENISRNQAASNREVQSTVFVPPLRSSSMPCTMCRHSCGDRFIPARSSMDMDFAQHCLTGPRKEEENKATASPSKVAYRKLLAEVCFGNRNRILAFKHKPTPALPVDGFLPEFLSSNDINSAKQRRHISQKAEKILRAPNIMNDYYLNLLDWGSSNVLAIALGYRVYLWTASNGSASKLFTVEEDLGPVTSVSWAPDGQHIAVGLNNSHIQLWDSTNNRLLRTLRGEHRSRVGALAWNNNILTTGDSNGKIVNNDVRIRSHAVQTYRGHTLEVCGLKWSNSGRQLASGGNDDLLHIWDISMSSSNAPRNQNQYMHRFDDHNAAVKALAWCPFQSNLLASGGGANDRCIKFWNINIGSCLNSIDTGSQVCSLLWNTKEHELLSSHGFTQNQLTLWKYPSMSKIAELTGHTSRVLFMAQSPDGCTVASAAEDETLRFWNVFGTPQVAKRAPKATTGPFSSINLIRLMMRSSRLKKLRLSVIFSTSWSFHYGFQGAAVRGGIALSDFGFSFKMDAYPVFIVWLMNLSSKQGKAILLCLVTWEHNAEMQTRKQFWSLIYYL